MSASIRNMQPSDLAEVIANERSAYEFPWADSIFERSLKRDYCVVVEAADGELLGHAILNVVADEASVFNIAVAPKAQRQGIGYWLLENLLNHARDQGSVEVFLEVRESNRPAFSLYHSVGFNEVGVRRNYYPAKNGREDAILLACYL